MDGIAQTQGGAEDGLHRPGLLVGKQNQNLLPARHQEKRPCQKLEPPRPIRQRQQIGARDAQMGRVQRQAASVETPGQRSGLDLLGQNLGQQFGPLAKVTLMFDMAMLQRDAQHRGEVASSRSRLERRARST